MPISSLSWSTGASSSRAHTPSCSREQGAHTELLAREGAYYRLYNAQFVQAITEADDQSTTLAHSSGSPKQANAVEA